jgi:glutaredoxin 3
MRYIFATIVFALLLGGGYFFYKANVEQAYLDMEEETFPACEISVLMYSSPYCKYCIAAKDLFNKLKIPFEDIDVNTSHSKRTEMVDKSGRKTVPQIFIDDHHVGGFDDLKALEDNGKLKKFMKTCDVTDLK